MRQYISIWYLLLFVFVVQTTEADDFLKDGFLNPPVSAKACTWWHWINGNITPEGITADLEAMKAVGIQEAQIFNVSLGEPAGNAAYLSDEWLELFKFAATEAQRLGLEITFHNGPGWSSSGGPWITPEYAMQKLVYSETNIHGGGAVNITLPHPDMNLNYYKDIAVLAFPKPISKEQIPDLDIKILDQRLRNHLTPDKNIIPTSATIRKSDIIDLTSQLEADGQLSWNAPNGDWVILRLGHTAIGTINRFASHGGKGLECDKMSSKALDVFWEGGINPIIEKLDTLFGTVVRNCLIDSYEVGTSNWTSGFEKEFKKLRSYDCLPYLPTLAGYYVESAELSERFLWDFRRTIGDLIAENYYGHFSELCHQHNVRSFVEPYWGPFDNMQVGATGDMVMCEFWSGNLAFFDSPKFVASIAKLNGHQIVGSEAFTGMGGWQQHPAMLKSIGDLAWVQGINRFVFHSYVHQPWDVPPGLSLGPFGIDFNRHNTWWKQGKAFLDYIARSQFLLQQGSSIADVLVFTGESSPNDALLMPEIKAKGYDYDLIGANKLASLSVKDGLIYTQQGDKYQVLVLPACEWLTPESLQAILSLARAGGNILGARPIKSPSLQNYPHCDQEVKELSNRFWNDGLVKDISILDFLEFGTLVPDFKVNKGEEEGLDYIHRKAGDADIYFVANSLKESRETSLTFRISGRKPELWRAESGVITNAAVWKDNGDGTTSVSISFEAEEAVFVVFRESNPDSNHIIEANIHLEKQNIEPLPNLQIIKAEQGIFLPSGLVDVTDVLVQNVNNDKLEISASRALCNCDPAPGYHKELRVEFSIDGKNYQANAMEKELFKIEAHGKLEIKKAIFGKFAGGMYGLPANTYTMDITDSIKNLVQSGVYDFVDHDKSLHIAYTVDGELREKWVDKGRILKLSTQQPKSKLIDCGDRLKWLTPYTGELTCQTAKGQTQTIKVKSVPDALELNKAWQLSFATKNNSLESATLDKLISWSASADSSIRYFSGTASYNIDFTLNKALLNDKTSLELDLGNVQIITEVIVNDKNLGILWKAPYRINLDGYVKEGVNALELRVTNRWTNRLIGDEQLLLDFKRLGPKVKEWPQWLDNSEKRSSERSTFSSFKHWKKEDDLQPSGLLGPVMIRPYVIKLKNIE